MVGKVAIQIVAAVVFPELLTISQRNDRNDRISKNAVRRIPSSFASAALGDGSFVAIGIHRRQEMDSSAVQQQRHNVVVTVTGHQVL